MSQGVSHVTMVDKMAYVSIRKYSPDFYQPNVGMSAKYSL